MVVMLMSVPAREGQGVLPATPAFDPMKTSARTMTMTGLGPPMTTRGQLMMMATVSEQSEGGGVAHARARWNGQASTMKMHAARKLVQNTGRARGLRRRGCRAGPCEEVLAVRVAVNMSGSLYGSAMSGANRRM